MIVTILSALAIAAFVIYSLVKIRHELHMMQQNSYRIERYWKWLGNNLLDWDRVSELIIAALALLFFGLGTKYGGYALLIIFFGLTTTKRLQKKAKKKLVFTQRATRLYAVAILLWAIPTFLILSTWKTENTTFMILPFLVVLSFVFMSLANIVLIPVERYINNWFIKDAKKRLKNRPDLMIIGITGSYGKTSTKHFLHRILSEKYHVLMTPGSYNTTMGVVRTIREYLKPTHQVFICEMGAKQLNDIKEICDIVHPTYGILTAVGEQHMDTFKTIENVQKTKFELIDALPPDGFGVCNADYEMIRNREVINTEVVYYSVEGYQADYQVRNISYNSRGSSFKIFKGDDLQLELETKLLGTYNLSNILASCILAQKLEVPDESISYAVKKLQPVQHRLEVKRNPNGVTIIDDAFNSNPLGAKMALEILGNIDGNRKVIVTPGMIELGEKQAFYNQEFGEQISEVCDYVVLVGKKQTEPIQAGLKNKGYPDDKIFVANNLKEATDQLNQWLQNGDVVLYENDLPDTYE